MPEDTKENRKLFTVQKMKRFTGTTGMDWMSITCDQSTLLQKQFKEDFI